jgi:hypothetical protein
MSATCPQGHQSDDPDWCSVCGAHLGDGAATPDSQPAPAPPAPDPVPAMACPICQTLRVGDEQFCEECGHDFLAPIASPADPPTAPVDDGPTAPLDDSRPAWRVIIGADRDHYDRNAPVDIAFPSGLPDRVVLLERDCVHIGRRSDTRRTHPEIDLAGPPEDTGVSRTHAELHRQADGSYALVDMGSANGTTVNGEPASLSEGESRRLRHGDHILLGAWTRITILCDPEPD